MSRWIHSRWAAFGLAMGAGVLIWAASPRVTGASEPWDADSFYYVGALVLAGCGIGLLAPKRSPVDVGYLLSVYIGVFGGQLGYALLFLPAGPLWILGGMFLAAFSIVSVVAALITVGIRHTIAK